MNNIHLCDAGGNLFSAWHLHPGLAQLIGYVTRDDDLDELIRQHLEMEECEEAQP